VLRERIESVHQRIARSCARSGREPSSVTLVAVTKGVPVEWVRDAVALGLTDFGENRVQEARTKQIALGWGLGAGGQDPEPRALSLQPVKWHLIGHLQRNKARHAVEGFDLIHSVDSVSLIEALEAAANSTGPPSPALLAGAGKPQAAHRANIQVFIQVNVSGESTKSGCLPEQARQLAEAFSRCEHVTLRGLMTMAPWSAHPEDARPHFRRLRELRDELVNTGSMQRAARSLSMGMSQDFEVAIEEGADIVRIGTAIFGTREQGNSELGMRSAE